MCSGKRHLVSKALEAVLLLRFILWLKLECRFSGEPDLILETLVNALYSSLTCRLTADERSWMKKLRSLRKELKASSVLCGRRGVSVGDLYDSSLTHVWAVLLFKLAREFHSSVGLELGTCLGISAAYQGSALKLNGGNPLTTLEGDPFRARLARAHFERLGLENVCVIVGHFQDVLVDTLESVVREYGPVDFVFIDGHHQERATIEYFSCMLPYLAQDAVLVFDDINLTADMQKAWHTIEHSPKLRLSLDLVRLGVCVVGQAPRKRILRYDAIP